MRKIKDDIGLCIHCNIEVANISLVDGCKCPKCGHEDFEEVLTDEWSAMSEEEKEDCRQYEEDNAWYNSVRMSS